MDGFLLRCAILALFIVVGVMALMLCVEWESYPQIDILDDPDVPEHVKDMFRENTREKE